MSKTVGFKTPLPKAQADAFVAKGKETYTEGTEPMKRLTLDVPDNLHKALKIKAIDEGCSVRDLVTLWVQERINKK
ncbi:MAG: hypothetical protein WCH05_09995 [Chlorobiaceae bacterium]|jgi:predicted HicB family RNase H-like nuclease